MTLKKAIVRQATIIEHPPTKITASSSTKSELPRLTRTNLGLLGLSWPINLGLSLSNKLILSTVSFLNLPSDRVIDLLTSYCN